MPSIAQNLSVNKDCIKYCTIAIVLLGLASCKIERSYVAPELEDVSKYRNSKNTDSTSFANSDWWTIFNDTALVSLIQEGLNGNLALQNTVSLIEQSRLQLEIAGAQL